MPKDAGKFLVLKARATFARGLQPSFCFWWLHFIGDEIQYSTCNRYSNEQPPRHVRSSWRLQCPVPECIRILHRNDHHQYQRCGNSFSASSTHIYAEPQHSMANHQANNRPSRFLASRSWWICLSGRDRRSARDLSIKYHVFWRSKFTIRSFVVTSTGRHLVLLTNRR